MAADFESAILKLAESQQIPQLEAVIKKTSTKDLIEVNVRRFTRSSTITFWNCFLRGFSDDERANEKRYSIVKACLIKLNDLELSYKKTYDIITRLLLDLPSFTNDQLIDLVEFSLDTMKLGDPKCVSWKDLLPEVLHILSSMSTLIVHGVKLSGAVYKTKIIHTLCTIKWPETVLTPIANMFRDIKLTSDEITMVLSKFCYSILKLEPLELPALAFQLFSLCINPTQVITILIAFQRYFYKFHYKKLFSELQSDTTDFDSIDAHSDKELREAEETILHHLSYCTQYKYNELQICFVLRGFSSLPDLVLTPFFLSSILAMSRSNREPDARLSLSSILPFLRSVIKNNEDEKELSKNSFWCRGILETDKIDLQQIFAILIDQNRDGKDVITPSLVNLSFILLKAKNSPILNQLGISFLQQFIRKRFIFGQGIIKNIAEWMIVDQEANQYSECLLVLSLSDTLTMSECIKTIKYVLDFFLTMPSIHVMRMMSFLLPVLKISHTVRDEFITILKKATLSRNPEICQMGVFGFGLLLKQLSNNNSQRTTIGPGNILTQQNISGYSLMTQSSVGNRNNLQRHFDILTLEIIGLLRNCFYKPLKIKETLYESLGRAIEFNPKLTTHLLHFIELHFRSYFNIEDGKCEINFTKVVYHQTNQNDIEIFDNLGYLTSFVANCVITCDKNELNYDTTLFREFFKTVIENIYTFNLMRLGICGPLDHKMNQVALQYIGIIDALMMYLIWTSTPENDNLQKMDKLFKNRQVIIEGVKNLLDNQSKKPCKKGKNETDFQTQNTTINGNSVKKIIFKPENNWTLPTLERYLRLLFDETVSFATSQSSGLLRCNRDLVRFVLESIRNHIQNLQFEPDYKQITHSRRIIKYLIEVTRVLYENCMKHLKDIWISFDITTAYLSADCFYQSLQTAYVIFKRKFQDYLNGVVLQPGHNQSLKKLIAILQDNIEKSFEQDNDLDTDGNGKKIPMVLLQSLEILYDFIPSADDLLSDSCYNWILNFCKNHELHDKDFGLIHKLLFTQRQKLHSGAFYNTIASILEKVLGQIDEGVELSQEFELKSITNATAETCLIYLINNIRKQIEDIEYVITKAKCLFNKIKLLGEDDKHLFIEKLKSLERSICSQLIHISNVFLHLANICIPLGSCMDTFIRIIMQMYVCLMNLTKYLVIRHTTLKVSLQRIKFEQLLRVCGKPLAQKIYNLITHIEGKICEDNRMKRKHNPLADKDKILKETKLIPNLILRIENFNKFVIVLSKKTDGDVAHFLHMGTVRDFRVKTSELKDAITKAFSQSSQIEVDETMLENDEQDEQSEEDAESLVLKQMYENDEIESNSNGEISTKPTSSSGSSILIDNENDIESDQQVLKNLAKINEKTRNRNRSVKDFKKYEAEPKKKRIRKSTK